MFISVPSAGQWYVKDAATNDFQVSTSEFQYPLRANDA